MDTLHQQIADLKLEGMTNTDIAKAVGCARQTVINYLKDGEVVAYMDEVRQEVKKNATLKLESALSFAIKNIVDLSKNSENDKIRLMASESLVDRVLGKPTTKQEVVSISRKSEKYDIEAELRELEAMLESEE